MRFVVDHILGDAPADPALAEWGDQGARRSATCWRGDHEIRAVLAGLSGGWIDPSYGGDPIRNPDALHTGRNIYGFDPTRIPTRNAYVAAQKAMAELIETHTETHGAAPKKLAFTLWSTETMRHLGLLEAQIMVAMGVRPIWDEGGRVTGMEAIPAAELGRPRIDPVISITGLYRDQFPPNVMERLNEGIVLVDALDETPAQNPLRANTARIADALRAEGVEGGLAEAYALTRIYGNESGNYGTGLPDAVMMSGKWEENDDQLSGGYLMRMSWGYGPDTALWSQRLGDGRPRQRQRLCDAAFGHRCRGLLALVQPARAARYGSPVRISGGCRWPSARSTGKARSFTSRTCAIRTGLRCNRPGGSWRRSCAPSISTPVGWPR